MAKNYNVTFVDKSSDVKKTLTGLSKAALRESGKVIRKYLRENIPVRSKKFKNHIGSWVMVNRNTGQPTLQIGFYGWQKVKKKGKQPSHANPHWIEFGTNPHVILRNNSSILGYDNNFFGASIYHPGTKPTNVLRNTVQNHIQDIRAAQAQYLAEIKKTLAEAGLKADDIDSINEEDD